MFEKLVPDARYDWIDLNHAKLASAEAVTIPAGRVQVISTGLHACDPMALSFLKGVGKLDMCVLLTTALTAGQEVMVVVMNRGTEPVTLAPGEWFLVACQLAVKEDVDVEA